MRGFITFLTVLFLTILVNSCNTTKVVPVREAHHSEHITTDKDSVHIVDSIFVYINGDTIRETRWRDQWRDRLIRDTVWLADTIPKVETVIVEKRLSRIEEWQMNIGRDVMWAVPIILCLYMLYRKFLK